MESRDLSLANGAVVGAWIKPRLDGEFGAVTRHVPKGFEAYARIFHPAFDRLGNTVSWKKVAQECGTTPHRQMQWHSILGFANADDLQGSYSPEDRSGPRWVGWDPPTGAMTIDVLDALCELLDKHTIDASHCFFGLCTIRGWAAPECPDDPPLLELPCERNHVVLTGSLSAIDQIMHDWLTSTQTSLSIGGVGQERANPRLPKLKQREAPNLIWPADHSWLVTSDVDFDSTLVGGSRPLIQSITESNSLEAWEVDSTDSLADDADIVNNRV